MSSPTSTPPTSSSTSPATTDDLTESTTDPETSSTSSDEESSSSSSGGSVDEGTYAALVRGTLFTDDLKAAQTVHDQVAMGGQDAAMAAGDFGHDAKLGTTLLGTTENEFMGLDQWDNLVGAQTLYADPKFAKAFGMLFDGPPNLELFELQEDWYGWGDPEAGDSSDPHWFVVIRGHLAADDADAAQLMHDPLAMGGEKAATALGDVAHVVWLGVEDELEFFAIDIWTDDTSIEAFYGDPDFQKAFMALFDAPPSVAVVPIHRLAPVVDRRTRSSRCTFTTARWSGGSCWPWP